MKRLMLVIMMLCLVGCASLPSINDVEDIVLEPAHLGAAYEAYMNKTAPIGILAQCVGCHEGMRDSVPK